MVLKRPKGIAQPAAQDLELLEHLVEKSIQVNPALSGGSRDTRKVIANLRQQAVAASHAKENAAAARLAAAPAPSLAERRRSTIAFFFDQKAAEYQQTAADLQRRQEQLDAERGSLREQLLGAFADFFSLMAGGAETPEAREVMRANEQFLNGVGINAADIIRLASQRR